MDKKLYFGGTAMPTPSKVKYVNEKIWSKNAGRTSNGTMVGDIIVIKRTLHIEWADLTPSQVSAVKAYVDSVQHSFFQVDFVTEEFGRVQGTFYAGSPSYEPWGWDDKRQLCQLLAVDLIQQ